MGDEEEFEIINIDIKEEEAEASEYLQCDLPYLVEAEHINYNKDEKCDELTLRNMNIDDFGGPFAGYIHFNKKRDGGFIVIDDIDIKQQYYWNKKIYFYKNDISYFHHYYGKERVIFDVTQN